MGLLAEALWFESSLFGEHLRERLVGFDDADPASALSLKLPVHLGLMDEVRDAAAEQSRRGLPALIKIAHEAEPERLEAGPGDAESISQDPLLLA